MVWLRQQAWLMQAVVVDLHATLPFIIITRCYGSRRGYCWSWSLTCMRRCRLLLLLVIGGMETVWLRQQAWLMQAMVLHATSPFIIITRCRRYDR